MIITVERIDATKLRRSVWKFRGQTCYRDVVVVLQEWEEQERPTVRHKWRLAQTDRTIPDFGGEFYRRRPHNGANHNYAYRRPAALVPFPDDVVAEAKAALMAAIIVEGPVDPKDRS